MSSPVVYKVEPNDNMNGLYSIRVYGTVRDNVIGKVRYIAAAPTHFSGSYMGSGLIYPSREVAFENTPTKGTLDGISFDLYIRTPSAYTNNNNNDFHPPEILFIYDVSDSSTVSGKKEKVVAIPVGNQIPYRNLHYYPNARNEHGVFFYDNLFVKPVRTQEQILRDSGYPERTITTYKIPRDFWGNTPAH